MMQINIPEVVAELTAEFDIYERAVVGGDFETLIRLFWDSPHTLRYGTTMRERRTLRNTRITTYGRDYGTANTEYIPDGSDKVGRQSQTWVRFPEGWKIVSAHVSFGI
jgi:hypothetical protein